MSYLEKGEHAPGDIQKYADSLNGYASDLLSVRTQKSEACSGLANWVSWLYRQSPTILSDVYKKAAQTSYVEVSDTGTVTFKQPWSQWLSSMAVAGVNMEARTNVNRDGKATVELHMLRPVGLYERDLTLINCESTPADKL